MSTHCIQAPGKKMAGQRMRKEVRERCEIDEEERVGVLRPEATDDPAKLGVKISQL